MQTRKWYACFWPHVGLYFSLVVSILKFVARNVLEMVPQLFNRRLSCVLLDLYLQMCLILSHPAPTADIPESPTSDCWTVVVVTLQILQNTPLHAVREAGEGNCFFLTAGMFGGASSSYKLNL